MNKFVKASVAGGAAIALLLGGAGTLALWNDNETVTGGTIAAGELRIENEGEAAWTANGQPIADLANFKMVPGDVLKLEQPLRLVAQGDNLKAHLSVNYGSVTQIPANAAGAELGEDILREGNPRFTFASSLPAAQVTAVPGQVYGVPIQSLRITPGAGGIDEVITATVEFTFPAAAGNDTMNAQLDLNNIGLVLTQTM
ncbi:MAG: alternate-type signal peptide domain-containing protein [Salinibacterium sp.]|nr:alternate-type signal peptide domain-containing protein [Salinibacterium sp.]MBF0671096.1 alternate-type signal peptide domain-containing protein [Salinibacterium sp.]